MTQQQTISSDAETANPSLRANPEPAAAGAEQRRHGFWPSTDRDRGRQVKKIVIINSGNARCPNRVRCTRRRPDGGGRLSSPRLVCNIISCYYYYYRRCNIRRVQLGRALYPPSPPLRDRRRDAPLLRDRFPPAATSVPGTLDDCWWPSFGVPSVVTAARRFAAFTFTWFRVFFLRFRILL